MIRVGEMKKYFNCMFLFDSIDIISLVVRALGRVRLDEQEFIHCFFTYRRVRNRMGERTVGCVNVEMDISIVMCCACEFSVPMIGHLY